MDDFIQSLSKSKANDVIVSIAAAEAAMGMNKGGETMEDSSVSQSQLGLGIKSSNKVPNDSDAQLSKLKSLTVSTQMSPDITKLSPTRTANKPPKIPNESVARRPSLARSTFSFSKPKSRLVEPPYPSGGLSLVDENTAVVASSSPYRQSPKMASPGRATASTPKASPVTPKTPLMASHGGVVEEEEEEEDDDVYKSTVQATENSGKKLNFSAVLEWAVFVLLMGLLIASLTSRRLIHARIWSLELWKWCVLAMVIFCGRLVIEWFINVVIFLIERNFLLRKKVLYFVYGLKRSVQIFLWLGSILLAWGLLFSHGFQRSRSTAKSLHYMTMALAGCVVGSAIWLAKTLFIKTLAVSFHVKRFFDRIQESLFHQYILQMLSGPPLLEMAERVGSTNTSGRLSFGRLVKGKQAKEEEVIDIEKLNRMKQEKVSAWTMRGLINVIGRRGLSTISNTLDEGDDYGDGQSSEEITSEWEAKSAAYQIFKNVAKPGCKYIEEEDLQRFMKKEEADHVFPLFEGAAATGKIKKSALRKWVVNAYLERKSLAHSLNDTKTAVDELNNIASGIVLIVIVIVWNLMMGFLTTKVLVLISSQLLLVVFMFGNTAKTVFESIIFVFVMHPFDVGDRCVIDGVQMVVEEMNILTTIFLRYDNEKIIYPNSVLATKPISNFYRSPEMIDSVEFSVHFSTSVETIGALKARIKVYIDSKPQHWRPNHSLQVKEIEDMNKMKMALYVNHTINFQNTGDKNSRRNDLVMELKKIFEDLGIKYHLLPQEVHVTYAGSPTATAISRC
ncbi:hypothetical protein Nepgr_005941 [Nepenthes gracilis]|uniref:Mechanosensitive ion channel protein n=1 Tax=Nepenthes gracilis TaxID=150966 RepID=A0AAD3S438_NEPGR|nr:hypothetical protein Nepgr_005941 [Nepenthes gracilis]